MSDIYDINFEPFVGKDYHAQSPKILVLGESHYIEGGQQPGKSFTIDVVQKYAKRETGERRRFFTTIAKAIDPRLTNESTPRFWEQIAFYNFVQVIVGETARKRPTNDMFTNSNQAFRVVIEQLRPDIIIVLGRRLGLHIAYHKDAFGPAFASAIVCYWTHPSTPKYFKIQQARQAFDVAIKQFADQHLLGLGK